MDQATRQNAAVAEAFRAAAGQLQQEVDVLHEAAGSFRTRSGSLPRTAA